MAPLPNWGPPLVPFHQLWIYMVGKKHAGKADQLTLASGMEAVNMHSFSVAISWGNRMNFSLYAKDVRILLRQSQITNAKNSNIYG